MKDIIISREVTTLNEQTDAMLVFDRYKDDFNYPLHYHPEYELNYICDCKDATRIVGDSIEQIGEFELCLVGPNLYHDWQKGKCEVVKTSREITTQFVPTLFPKELLSKDIIKPIADLLKRAEHGVLFTAETAQRIEPLLSELAQTKGFEAYLIFQRIMYELAVSPDQRTLASESFQKDNTVFFDARMERIHNFIMQNHNQKVMLTDVAQHLNMAPVTVTRLIKQRTGKSFIDFLNDIRLGFATRMMVDSDMNISEICFSCGFNNISNFNRIFKKRQGLTPTEFRQTFHGTKRVF
ncbi:MAG: AraC family transcriptional regulator [Bacteroidales bacterium]|nr:AraC family transcriptional regulator [Bacteroidales bacterium]